LLSSHDDLSVVQLLPPGVAVATQLRDPIERFLSAYEFGVEVAARQLKRPPRNSTAQPQQQGGHGAAAKTLTDQVWPWSHLVPFFVADMRARVCTV
jgi:hypothetical protein